VANEESPFNPTATCYFIIIIIIFLKRIARGSQAHPKERGGGMVRTQRQASRLI
jgi:hypothetical protein